MRTAWEAYNGRGGNGTLSATEMTILLRMFKLCENKSLDIAQNLANKYSSQGGFFSYEEFIKQLHKKKYAYLETLPKSLET